MEAKVDGTGCTTPDPIVFPGLSGTYPAKEITPTANYQTLTSITWYFTEDGTASGTALNYINTPFATDKWNGDKGSNSLMGVNSGLGGRYASQLCFQWCGNNNNCEYFRITDMVSSPKQFTCTLYSSTATSTKSYIMSWRTCTNPSSNTCETFGNTHYTPNPLVYSLYGYSSDTTATSSNRPDRLATCILSSTCIGWVEYKVPYDSSNTYMDTCTTSNCIARGELRNPEPTGTWKRTYSQEHKNLLGNHPSYNGGLPKNGMLIWDKVEYYEEIWQMECNI